MHAVSIWGLIYKISYDLSQRYLEFVVRWTYDRDLKRAKIIISEECRKQIYEYYFRRSYNFASESYIRKALRSL